MNKYLSPATYIKSLLHAILYVFAPVIRLWEQIYFYKYSQLPLRHQPIFIIGAPRTGSTIAYQAITNQFDVSYIDNFCCLFKNNLCFGFWLSQKLFQDRAHNTFSSKHGNTNGMHAPSECGGYWYRWLRKDRHFIDYMDFEKSTVKQIYKEISSVINYYDRPLVIKNLNAGQRLRLISKAFPNAQFIYIRREPFFTAQSILIAKRSSGIADNEFWSIMPKETDALKKMNWNDQIVQQIYYLEKQIAEDVKLFSESLVLEIDYVDLNQSSIQKIAEAFNLNERREFAAPDICIHENVSISSEEEASIRESIAKLEWTNTDVK